MLSSGRFTTQTQRDTEIAQRKAYPTFRLRAAGFDFTKVSAAFFFAAGAALTIGLREEAWRLFFSAVMMSRRGISSTFSNSVTFLPLILDSISFRKAS